MDIKKGLVGAVSLSLPLTGCGLDSDRFENMPGDIQSGTEVEVIEKWYASQHTGKHGPHGWVLFLTTEDCKGEKEPIPGPEVGEDCDLNRHKVNIETYGSYQNGDTIYWDDQVGPSEVVEHRRGWQYYYKRVYWFSLLVKQCLPNKPDECVTDQVPVHPDLWFSVNQGDKLTFANNEDGSVKVVSQ